MNQPHRRLLSAGLLCLGLLVAPARGVAQELYTFTVSALGGAGGFFDVDPDPGFGNLAYQLGFSWVTEPRTHVGLRLGHLDLNGGKELGSLRNGEVTYLTVAGEYRFRYPYYESGLYIGLGAYRLEGTRTASGRGVDETALGGVLGVTGEFGINRRLGILVELAGHYADFDDAQFFAVGHAGVAIHF